MVRRSLVLALLGLAPLPAAANTVGCGGNSGSYVEIDPAPARRGTIVAMPDSLCANLIEHRRGEIRSLDVVIDPRDAGPARRPSEGRRPGRRH
jgi:hypothetical protein